MSQEIALTQQDTEMADVDVEDDVEEEELAPSDDEAEENPYPPQEMDLEESGEDPTNEETKTKDLIQRSRMHTIIGTHVRPTHFHKIALREACPLTKASVVFWSVVLDHIAVTCAAKIMTLGAIAPEKLFKVFFNAVTEVFSVRHDLNPGSLQESEFMASVYAKIPAPQVKVKKQENEDSGEPSKTAEPNPKKKQKKKKALLFMITAGELYKSFEGKVSTGRISEFKYRMAYCLNRVSVFICHVVKQFLITYSGDNYKSHEFMQLKEKHCKSILAGLAGGDSLRTLNRKISTALKNSGAAKASGKSPKTKSEPQSAE